MYALKRELKLNKVETSLMRGCAGFKRWVYNFGLEMLTASWEFLGVKASDSKRLDAIKQVLTQFTMQQPEYAWMKKYPSTVYQSAFIDLKDAFTRWRQGLAEFPKKKSKKKGDSFTVKYGWLDRNLRPWTRRCRHPWLRREVNTKSCFK